MSEIFDDGYCTVWTVVISFDINRQEDTKLKGLNLYAVNRKIDIGTIKVQRSLGTDNVQ